MRSQNIHMGGGGQAPIARMQNEYLPLDPQIMEDVRNHLGGYNQSPSHPLSQSHSHSQDNDDAEFEHDDHHQHDSDFQRMLGGGSGLGGRDEGGNEDLDMLIDQDDDGEDEDEEGDIIQTQAEAAARAAEEALRTVGREYGGAWELLMRDSTSGIFVIGVWKARGFCLIWQGEVNRIALFAAEKFGWKHLLEKGWKKYYFTSISKPLLRIECSERAHYHEREFNSTKIQVAIQLYFSLYSFVSSHV
jgi:hypothetical protein